MFKRGVPLLICINFILISHGQQMTTKIIVSDHSTDFILINAEKLSFDQKGNYLFQVKKNNGSCFISNTDTIGPLKNTSTTYSTRGNLTYGYDDKKFLYYLNPNDCKVYGPVKGKIETGYTNHSYDYIIVTILNGDSLYYYANGELINTKHKTKGNSPMMLNDWVTFSSDKKIYVTDQKGQWSVISGDKIIATSENTLSQPAMNDSGDYLFVEGMKPKQPSRYSYQFFIHTKDTILGPVRTVWSYKLNADGSWYYTGDDDGPDYIAINNKLYKDIDTIENIILLDKDNYFFTYKKKGKTFYNHNGGEYEHVFKYATNFKIDREGNLSFYYIKDYFLYKVLNGRIVPQPITNYGVRPFPIFLSATGTSFHCFVTDDSMYLYKDDQLLFPPESVSEHFEVKDLTYEFPLGEKNNNHYPGKEFEYFEWGDSGYIIYNETISRGMMPFVDGTYMKKRKAGEIVGGSVISTGFFVIQKIGEEKYFININNKIYKELNNISRLIPDFSFFSKNKLVFYALQGKDFIQHTIEF